MRIEWEILETTPHTNALPIKKARRPSLTKLVTPGKVPDEFILDPESVTREKGWIYISRAPRRRSGRRETGRPSQREARSWPQNLTQEADSNLAGEAEWLP